MTDQYSCCCRQVHALIPLRYNKGQFNIKTPLRHGDLTWSYV